MTIFPKENIYGHTKKLKFILDKTNKYIQTHEVREEYIKILDFGCGNGSAVSQFVIGKGIKYYGVDIHIPSIEYAKKHFANENAVFLNSLPEGIQFDVIIYSDILEHVNNPDAVLKQHYNLLSDKGIIIVVVPNGFGPFEKEKRLDRLLGISKWIFLFSQIKKRILGVKKSEDQVIPYNNDSGHVQFFTKDSLCLLLRQNGFNIKNFKKGAFIGAPISERIFRCYEWFIKLNCKIADILPYWAVSTWYLTAKKNTGRNSNNLVKETTTV